MKISERRKRAFQSAVIDWAKENFRKFPWRERRTPYSVFVAEVLLKRTTATAVLRVYSRFMELYPGFRELAEADRAELEKLLSSIGYHKLRAAALIEMAEYVTEEYRGRLPPSKEGLLKIPHVGPYTAGATLSLGYGISAAMVDSNVERILKRVFCVSLPPRPSLKIILDLAETLVPRRGHQAYNFGLLDLGALVCRYDRPRCQTCPLKTVCDYPEVKINTG
jgi:A/G-specific adenine glycosylase